ncbi:MAG TPA: thioredoxin family protein [Pirellulaceae bacterium]|nr:thioredoxin family protein [Pirellulaceae bacterium]HMO92848.1 thioredoxin family protein [Pirellulaceae bacterium]HMP69410.1 thioredoxin family protein [Pirellulaceae bacterium]
MTSKGWFQSYNQALAKSKETGKPILMEFTGSDWCPPCQMLADRIFSTDEFKQWAKEHVVLLELDFPRKNPSFPAALMNQNQELAQKHKVSGFPTLIFLDSSENKIGQTSGYNGKDVEDYLKMFEEMIGS